MDQLDKILTVAVDTQTDVKELKGRVGYLEEVQEKNVQQARWISRAYQPSRSRDCRIAFSA